MSMRSRIALLIIRAGEVRPTQVTGLRKHLSESRADRYIPRGQGKLEPSDGAVSLPTDKYWAKKLEIDYSTGKPEQTIENARLGIQMSPKLHDILRFNSFAVKYEVAGARWRRPEEPDALMDADLSYIYEELQKGGLRRKDDMQEAVTIEARRKVYHPIRDILNRLQWDGKDHFAELLPRYLGAAKTEYTTVATRLMFGGLVNRIMNPGCKYDTMVILIDEKQGGGKSTMCRFLAIKDDWYTAIKDLEKDNKVVEIITGHLVVEMEELEGMVKAKNIETVRSVLSAQKDTYRVPYDKYPQDVLRQNVFIGTSNDIACLPRDRAGNRRFIPVMCSSSKAEQHPLDNEAETRADIMQCYAQAMELYRRGELETKLPKEWEIALPTLQKEYMPEDTKALNIQAWIEDNWREFYCVQMIYKEALGGMGTPVQWETKEIAKILDTLECRTGKRMLRRRLTVTGSHKLERFEDSDDPAKKYGRQKAWELTEEAKIERYITHSIYDTFSIYQIYSEAGIKPKGLDVKPTQAELDMMADILDRVVDDDGQPMLKRDLDKDGKVIWTRA